MTSAIWWPQQRARVIPMVADVVPEPFTSTCTEVTAIDPRRSFWEKVTILHENAHRPADSRMPNGYSRHYADVVAMARRRDLLEESLADLALLKAVVAHKQRFYHRGWANFANARPPTLRLLPSDSHVAQLRGDYAAMRPIFMAEPPSFERILEELARLTERINDGEGH